MYHWGDSLDDLTGSMVVSEGYGTIWGSILTCSFTYFAAYGYSYTSIFGFSLYVSMVYFIFLYYFILLSGHNFSKLSIISLYYTYIYCLSIF